MRIPQSKQEKGFTLIELLVVVVIIGILAAIAIPVFLNQRQKAADSAAKSDLKNAATAQEAYAVDNGGAYTDTLAGLESAGFRKSADVAEPTITLIGDGGTGGYCMLTKADSGSQVWVYKSNEGGLQGKDVVDCT